MSKMDNATRIAVETKVIQILHAFGIDMAPDGKVVANIELLRAIDLVALNNLYQQNGAVDGRLVISNCGTVKVKNATKLI